MSNTLISAKYPLSGGKDFFEIYIGQIEIDPESPNNDCRCECKLSAPNYRKSFYVYGIDELQCVWLALRQLQVEIIDFEIKSGLTCEYRFFQDVEYKHIPIE